MLEELLPFISFHETNDIYLYLSIFISSFLIQLTLIKTKFFVSKNYKDQVQKIHLNDTSRHGGLGIFVVVLFFSIYLEEKILSPFCIIYLIIFFVTFMEDSFHSIQPKYRLISILCSSTIAVIYLQQNFGLPEVHLPIFNLEINNQIVLMGAIIFFISSIINGSNLIDGANGLCAFSFLSILFTLYYFANKSNDAEILDALHIIIPTIIAFSILNFPKGRIFLGDNGAYFIGYITSILIFIYIINNPNIPSWSIIALLFYPGFEVLFSFIRKTFNKKNPFKADNEHLHLLTFKLLKSGVIYNWVANSLVTVFLIVVWLVPCILVLVFSRSILSILIILLISIYIYLSLYYAVKYGSKK